MLEMPPQIPHDLAWATNPTTRTARFVYRGKLELVRHTLDVPFWVIKAIAAGIVELEAEVERQGAPFPKVQLQHQAPGAPNPNPGG